MSPRPRMSNLAKRTERPAEEFSLQSTLHEYKVEELNAQQAARLVAEIRRGVKTQGTLPPIDPISD